MTGGTLDVCALTGGGGGGGLGRFPCRTAAALARSSLGGAYTGICPAWLESFRAAMRSAMDDMAGGPERGKVGKLGRTQEGSTREAQGARGDNERMVIYVLSNYVSTLYGAYGDRTKVDLIDVN